MGRRNRPRATGRIARLMLLVAVAALACSRARRNGSGPLDGLWLDFPGSLRVGVFWKADAPATTCGLIAGRIPVGAP